MLAERDPNGSGRTSRASNLSAVSRATFRNNGGADKQDLLASAPGVMSMLRTSTEMGNLTGLMGDVSGLGNVPRAPQRRGASSRLSTASSMSGTSSRTSRHHRQWPSSSSAPRRSSTREPSGPQYVADTLSPTVMDLLGPSPLLPMRDRSSRNNRDSQRSFSMTNTTQPTFRLSSNRSLGSLRSHELIQRPKSPYVYPTRLRRPSYRPASPALSDATGSRSRRLHGQGYQGQLQHPGPMRSRRPSDASLGCQDRAPGMPRRPSRGHPHAYYNGLQGDIPPVPPLFNPRVPFERPRVIQSSLKGSFSSVSTNMRNDSDTPSFDLPSPSTPRDGSSLEVMLSPTGTQVLVDTVSGTIVKEEAADGPLYYDYSEQFEREQLLEPEVNPVPTCFAKIGKTIQEERSHSEQSASLVRGASSSTSVRVANTAVPGIAELPASPVARRITRDMILEALGPASTTEDVNHTGDVGSTDGNLEDSQHADNNVGQDSTQESIPTREDGLDKRFSILSDADSSVVNSSTFDFAVRYAIPIVAGTQVDSVAPPMPDRDPPLPLDTALSTEVDMSDLLAGYQHTDSRQYDESAAKEEENDTRANTDRRVESRSSHAQKSSDPQSFKSATDVLESEHSDNEPDEDDDAKSYKSCPDAVVEEGSSVKEVDAHSFKTAKDAVTPGRSVSVPLTKALPITPAEVPAQRPTSEALPSTPAPAVLRKPRVPLHESGLPLAKLRASSKPSIKQGSVSISGSSSTLSVSHQPPLVPPRDSSASKEAQRLMGVASWMLLKRWGKKANKTGDGAKADSNSRETLQVPRPTDSVVSSQHHLSDAITTPEKALSKETSIPRKPVASKDPGRPQVHNASVVTALHQPSSSSPVSAIADPPSIPSSKGSSTVSRVQSSPAGVPQVASNRRDSQTTTHLAWHGRKSLNLSNPATSISESHLPLSSSTEDTTTDLRLSQYRYPGGLHYLPDLKEESHEDSSLNTSASNLKNSNFRFPFGVPGGVRASVDDGALFSRRSSMGSYRRSALGSELSQAHELPSMRFSRMNLFDKVDEVVGLRSSRSLSHLLMEAPELHDNTPQRPGSARELREKYRSFCDRLDQLNTTKDIPRAEIASLVLTRRELSPEFMAEIEQVTIPSVNGLTERFSELLPSLREFYKTSDPGLFVDEELIMEHAMEDIHELGGPALKRSSARLRPMPGSPHMVVIEDALYEELTNKEIEDDVAVAQGDEEVVRAQGESHASKTTKANSTVPPQTPLVEFPTPSPTLPRPRALTVGHHDLRSSAELGLTTRSLRSFASTPTKTDTRPWNSDKNYPWATTTTVPFVDISLPLPAKIKHSPRPGPSHLRNNISDTSTVSTFTPVRSPFGTDSDSSAYARQLQRFSQFGRSGDLPHAAGERYPTSALTPPTAIFRDDFSASDTSDDDTELQGTRKGKFNLKKRFSSARNATLENSTRTTDKIRTTSTNPVELASPEPAHLSTSPTLHNTAGEVTASTSNRHTFRDAQGMPSVIYHRHRLIDHLKRWWHKGGDLVRNLQVEGYAHYKSAAFARGLYYSSYFFEALLQNKRWPRIRPWGVPNTPAELADGESVWSSDDGYENEHWGPDEDYYISMQEGLWF